jgi:hypothetical protein
MVEFIGWSATSADKRSGRGSWDRRTSQCVDKKTVWYELKVTGSASGDRASYTSGVEAASRELTWWLGERFLIAVRSPF